MQWCSFLSSLAMADIAAALIKIVTKKLQMLRESSWVYDKWCSPSGAQLIVVTGCSRFWPGLWVSGIGIPAAEREKYHTGTFAVVV